MPYGGGSTALAGYRQWLWALHPLCAAGTHHWRNRPSCTWRRGDRATAGAFRDYACGRGTMSSAFAMWSGGKNCHYALYRALQAGLECERLVTFIDEETDLVLSHRLPPEL